MNKHNIFQNKLKGMSFVEAIIAIFIFAVVMFSVMMIFTSSFGGYKKADKMAKNIEDAQFAMNLIAKSLRTSDIISMTPASITAYDYSEQLCNTYSFSGGQITRAWSASVGCAVMPNGPTPITSQYIEGSFSGVASNGSSSPKTMGKVTIWLKVCSEAGCAGPKNDSVVLQTTVSLRDYSTVGL